MCSDGVCEPVRRVPEGEEGGACFPNRTCFADHACVDGVCVARRGGAGERCYPNDTCDRGLYCSSTMTCEPMSQEVAAEMAHTCRTRFADDGNTCIEAVSGVDWDPRPLLLFCGRLASEERLECLLAAEGAHDDPTRAARACQAHLPAELPACLAAAVPAPSYRGIDDVVGRCATAARTLGTSWEPCLRTASTARRNGGRLVDRCLQVAQPTGPSPTTTSHQRSRVHQACLEALVRATNARTPDPTQQLLVSRCGALGTPEQRAQCFTAAPSRLSYADLQRCTATSEGDAAALTACLEHLAPR